MTDNKVVCISKAHRDDTYKKKSDKYFRLVACIAETIYTFRIFIEIYISRRKTWATQTYIENKSKIDLPDTRCVPLSVKVYK